MCETRSLRPHHRVAGPARSLHSEHSLHTERYPEKVARRLRAVNIAALIAAASSSFFTIHRLIDGPAGQWRYPDAIAMLVSASIPLLHRFRRWRAGTG
jgi:MASE7